MNKKLKIVIIIAVLGAALYGIYASGLVDILQDFDKFKELIEEAGSLGYIIYIAIFVIAAIFSLPASIITITGGVVFGPILGALLALVGATIGAIAAFLVSRYIARGFIVDKFGNNAIFKKIESGVEKNGKDFLILTRLVPVFPYNIQNYAYGVTNIKLATYSIITLITMAPGAFIYAYMAGDIAENGITTNFFIKLVVAGIVLFGVSQIPKIFAKKKGINIDEISSK